MMGGIDKSGRNNIVRYSCGLMYLIISGRFVLRNTQRDYEKYYLWTFLFLRFFFLAGSSLCFSFSEPRVLLPVARPALTLTSASASSRMRFWPAWAPDADVALVSGASRRVGSVGAGNEVGPSSWTEEVDAELMLSVGGITNFGSERTARYVFRVSKRYWCQ